MGKKLTNKRAVAGAFADAMNLLYEGENKYHQQVAYLAYRMAEELGFAEHERETVIMAALLHDCGMVILPENKEYPFRELAAAGLNLVGDINILQFVRRIFLAGQTEYKGTRGSLTSPSYLVRNRTLGPPLENNPEISPVIER